MNRIVDIKSKKPLLGTWKCCDGFSDIQFTISTRSGVLAVDGTDTHDGEKAEIHDVLWLPDESTLKFSAHLPSTGRFTRYRFQPSPLAGRVGVTYTYTAQEIWEKV